MNENETGKTLTGINTMANPPPTGKEDAVTPPFPPGEDGNYYRAIVSAKDVVIDIRMMSKYDSLGQWEVDIPVLDRSIEKKWYDRANSTPTNPIFTDPPFSATSAHSTTEINVGTSNASLDDVLPVVSDEITVELAASVKETEYDASAIMVDGAYYDAVTMSSAYDDGGAAAAKIVVHHSSKAVVVARDGGSIAKAVIAKFRLVRIKA